MIFFLSKQNRLVYKVSFSLYLLVAQSSLLGHFSKRGTRDRRRGRRALGRGKKSRALYSLPINSRMFTTLLSLLVKASEVGNNVTP